MNRYQCNVDPGSWIARVVVAESNDEAQEWRKASDGKRNAMCRQQNDTLLDQGPGAVAEYGSFGYSSGMPSPGRDQECTDILKGVVDVNLARRDRSGTDAEQHAQRKHKYEREADHCVPPFQRNG